jgi:hypothetical protein
MSRGKIWYITMAKVLLSFFKRRNIESNEKVQKLMGFGVTLVLILRVH